MPIIHVTNSDGRPEAPRDNEEADQIARAIECGQVASVKIDCGRCLAVTSYQLGKLAVLRRACLLHAVPLEIVNVSTETERIARVVGMDWLAGGKPC